MHSTRKLTMIVLALLLAACGSALGSAPAVIPAMIAPASALHIPTATAIPHASEMPVNATTTAAYNAQQPRDYEGDMANSITIQVGDVFTIHNPDFDKSYTFTVQAIDAQSIVVVCTDPAVKINDVGFDDGKGLLLAFSLDGTFTRPIGWARFTPKEHIPVVQFYSIASGGFIERGQRSKG